MGQKCKAQTPQPSLPTLALPPGPKLEDRRWKMGKSRNPKSEIRNQKPNALLPSHLPLAACPLPLPAGVRTSKIEAGRWQPSACARPRQTDLPSPFRIPRSAFPTSPFPLASSPFSPLRSLRLCARPDPTRQPRRFPHAETQSARRKLAAPHFSSQLSAFPGYLALALTTNQPPTRTGQHLPCPGRLGPVA
jgi:hypothetical protein